jgi:hypothetical protein
MKNTKTFSAMFPHTELPARSVYIGLTEELHAPQGDRVGKIEGDTLESRLKNLGEQKKEKLKLTSQVELKRLAETLKEKDWEVVADKVHTLSEWHKREVGTAIEVGKNQYLLIHASEEAVQLILAEHKGKSAEDLQSELAKLGIACDAKLYAKDKIPTAKPISKYLEGRGKPKVKPAAATDDAEAKIYNQALENVNADLKKQPKVASPVELLTAKHPKYKVALSRLYGGKDNIPAEVSRVFNLSGEIDAARLSDSTYAKEKLNGVFRAGSTRQLEAKVREAQKDLEKDSPYYQSLEETLAAFKVLDITYGNIEGSSPEKRLAIMDKNVKKLSGMKDFDAQKLFADPDKGVGADLDWQSFYKASTKAKSRIAQISLNSILKGGDVQMLRVDRADHNSDKFEAFIDRMPGSALVESMKTPQEVRGDKEYVYKYQSVSGAPAEAAVANYLKNHPELAGVLQGKEAAQFFTVAQVEIPNCENPAIVVKPKLEALQAKPVVAAAVAPTPVEEALECEETLSIMRVFSNVPGGVGLIFRPLDWFTSDSRKNHLADPAILSMDGKVLRESEYLNASKRLGIKFDKRLNNQAAKIVGDTETVPEFLKGKSKVDGKEIPQTEALDLLMKSLSEKVGAAGVGKTGMEALSAKALALKEWREAALKEAGYSYNNKRLVKLAEFMYEENLPTAEKLQTTLKRESTAYELLKFKQNWKETIFESKKTFAQLQAELPQTYTQVIGFLNSLGVTPENDAVVNDVVEKALYERQNLNITRPPEFAGDVMVIPPYVGDQLTMHRMGSELGKELLNTQSPLGHMLQIALAASGYLLYLKTGTGIPNDLPEIYRKKIEELARNGGDPKTILDDVEYKDFERFIRTGEVGCGKQVISIPVNEVRLLIPGWNLLELWGAGAGAGGKPCPTGVAGGSSGGGAAGGGI